MNPHESLGWSEKTIAAQAIQHPTNLLITKQEKRQGLKLSRPESAARFSGKLKQCFRANPKRGYSSGILPFFTLSVSWLLSLSFFLFSVVLFSSFTNPKHGKDLKAENHGKEFAHIRVQPRREIPKNGGDNRIRKWTTKQVEWQKKKREE